MGTSPRAVLPVQSSPCSPPQGVVPIAPALAQADVEQQVSDQLAAQVGQTPDDITCPGDLPAEVGATMTCLLTAGTDTIDVYLTVTTVDGMDVGYDIKVADQVN